MEVLEVLVCEGVVRVELVEDGRVVRGWFVDYVDAVEDAGTGVLVGEGFGLGVDLEVGGEGGVEEES